MLVLAYEVFLREYQKLTVPTNIDENEPTEPSEFKRMQWNLDECQYYLCLGFSFASLSR